MPGIQRENLCKASAISVKTNLEVWMTDSERELDVLHLPTRTRNLSSILLFKCFGHIRKFNPSILVM